MKRLLGPCLAVLVLLLGGCGDGTSDVASDPSSGGSGGTTSSTPTDKSSGSTDAQTIAILSQTGAGGRVDVRAVRLDDPTAREQFVSQFNRPGLGARVEKAVASATVPSGYALLGAVVSLGCDVPPGVNVTVSPGGYLLEAQPVPSPLKECFAPVTTVAIVAVPM
jgi:hypothetical protein